MLMESWKTRRMGRVQVVERFHRHGVCVWGGVCREVKQLKRFLQTCTNLSITKRENHGLFDQDRTFC